MKNKNLLFICFIFIIPYLISSCSNKFTSLFNDCNPRNSVRDVVLSKTLPIDNVKLQIHYIGSKKYNNPGEIYKYKNYLLIKENRMGLHVINNTNSSNPQKIGFITIPFIESLDIKDDILIAYTNEDILTINTKNIETPKLIHSVTHAIPISWQPAEKNLVIGYKISKENYVYKPCVSMDTMIFASINNYITQFTNNLENLNIRSYFSLIKNKIYKLDRGIALFNINDEYEINRLEIEISDLELYYGYYIKSFKDYIFLSKSFKTKIYENSDNQKPKFLKNIDTNISCNASIFDNNILYVSGQCQYPSGNRMDIMDFSNLNEIKYIASYPNINPLSLDFKNNILFVADKSNKIKIYDTQNLNDLKLLKEIQINKIKSISVDNDFKALIISDEGFYQYDFSNIKNGLYNKLSFTKVEKDIYFKTKDKADSKNEKIVSEDTNNYYYKWYKEYFADILPFKEI